MFRWLARRRAERAETDRLMRAALAAFSGAYPDKRVIGDMARVHHRGAGFTVIQVCYMWEAIPPKRTWWLVTPSLECRELSYDEANTLAPVPAWR